ncbi:MAG: nucleotidyl transferase AbiEii/AbiGii toxin family protein [Candidatus Promineofilum sp.]|nr:nucleotidyl transferase AbiEii/AbiGii toxin family protein [Promineifilum sp.]MBP9656439.1 nucleotidyl transferase AbiEii/AbiGii toxin family protein [Promineifilum sp.]
MRQVEDDLWEVHAVLIRLHLPYAIIGGAAVQIWGEPRFTQDLDLAVLAPIELLSDTVDQILAYLHPRFEDAREFAHRNRVLLVQTSTGYPVDVSFGLPGYEEMVIERAIDQEIAPGKSVRFCSPEDLIIHKSVAGRIQDVLDIQSVISRHMNELDLAYIRNWLKLFAEWLESDDVIDRFEKAWREYGPQS